MKRICLIAMAFSMLLAASSWAQSPVMPGVPLFVGVPPMTGYIPTDPFWDSTPSNGNGTHRVATGDYTHHTNSLGGPSYFLRPLTVPGSQSDLYFSVPNHFAGPGNQNPLYHTLIFWRRGNWVLNDGQLVIHASSGELFPRIYEGTTEEWVQESYVILPAPGPYLNVTFTATKTGNYGLIEVNIDAVEIFPNIPINNVVTHTDTNFVVTFIPPTSVEVKWNTVFYGQNYSLVAADDIVGPYLPISYTTNSAGGTFIKTLLPATQPTQYFQLRR